MSLGCTVQYKTTSVNPNNLNAEIIHGIVGKHAQGEEQWLHLPVDR
jgi:hypothetical protein